MKNSSIPPGSDLDLAATEVVEAFLRYREVMKRDARGLLGGVIWIESGNDFVLYSESAVYTARLKEGVESIRENP